MPNFRSALRVLPAIALSITAIGVQANAQTGASIPVRQDASTTTVRAQPRTIPVHTVTTPVESAEPFQAMPSMRPLPGERLLVHDQRGKRVLVFDSTLKSFTLSADSASVSGTRYTGEGPINPLLRYVGDSSLIADIPSRVFIVIDPSGKLARPMAPVTEDLFAGAQPFVGNPAADTLGRLIYAGGTTRPNPKAGDPPITDTRDTVRIVRSDFNKRVTDTIGSYTVPRVPRPAFTAQSNGKSTGSLLINAGLSGPDEFAVLSDGTLAVVRDHDYVVDWTSSDGVKSSTGKLPHETVRQTDEMKLARIDSMKRVIDSVSQSGRPYGMTIRGIRGVDGGPSKVDTIIPTIRFAPTGDMADYPPAFRRGLVRADERANLWVLPTATSLSKGGLVYDVISRKDGVHERVQIPEGYVVLGFGKGDVVYLAKNSPVTKM